MKPNNKNYDMSEQPPSTARPKVKKPEKAQLRTLSKDSNIAMQEMIETIDMLRDVYERETHALKHSDIQTFMQLQEKKLFAAYQYQADMKDMLERVDTLKSEGKSQILDELKEKYTEFTNISSKNSDALERMERIMGRLSDRLVNAAKRAAMADGVSYSASGALDGKARQVVTTGISETA